MGRIKNTSDKKYSISVDVSIRDYDGYLLYKDNYEQNYAFVYESSTALTRESDSSPLDSKDLKISYTIKGDNVGYFVIDQSYMDPYEIDDVLNIRRWNSEPYLLYITINSYSDR